MRAKGTGMRWASVVPIALMALLASQDPALTATKEVKIKRRHGGDVLKHVNEATTMMGSGKNYRVTGDQYSAAAMQVLFIESQFPDRICATRRVKLHFHLGIYEKTNEKMKAPDWVFTRFIRPENMKRLGDLPEFGKGFKTVKASDYLGLCK
jgi:hypothetical protein